MRKRKIASKDFSTICTVCGSTTSMDLMTSRFTPYRVPGAFLICRSKLNFTSSAVSSPYPLWNCTPFLSLNVQIVPSGESVQLSARSGSTSAVVTLPSLMAKRVSPRNMKRVMACDCPSVLECGSRVSGSLAATFRIFLRWASAAGGPASATNPTAKRVASTATSMGENRDRRLDMNIPLSEMGARASDQDRMRAVVSTGLADGGGRCRGPGESRDHDRFDHAALRRTVTDQMPLDGLAATAPRGGPERGCAPA